MVIGIDGNEANYKDRVGVHQYAFEIIRALYLQNSTTKKAKRNYFIIYLKNSPQKDFPKKKTWWKYKILPRKKMWVLSTLMPHLWKNKNLDVFFSPSHYLPFVPKLSKVCTIHDLGYLEFSEQFKKYDYWQLKCWSAISIFISKYIISVSIATSNDIVRRYPFASNKINVVHHGYDKNRFKKNITQNDVRRVRKKYSLDTDYILFLSTLKPSKNIEGLLEAYKILLAKYDSQRIKLVIAGKKGWLYKSVFERTKKLGLTKSVLFTDYLSEGDKAGLLKGAKVFVSPSFWEGFGMHILEAMACGVPVVVSNVASIPEVVGKAGVYVDPDNPADISAGMDKILSLTKAEYNKSVERSIARAKRFSWDRAARGTLKVITKVSGQATN